MQLQPDGSLGVQVGEEGNEVVGPRGVSDPASDVAFVHVDRGEQPGGAVPPVLELAPNRKAGCRWAG